MKRLLLSIVLSSLMLMGMLIPVAADEATTETEPDPIMAVKAAWGLRLREAAGLSAKTLLVLRCGEQVTLIGEPNDVTIKNGLVWVEVSVTRDDETTIGFVSREYLTKNLKPSCYLWAPGPVDEPACKPPRPPHPPKGPPGGGPPNGGFPGGGPSGGGRPGRSPQ